jgi:hypothetical protein
MRATAREAREVGDFIGGRDALEGNPALVSRAYMEILSDRRSSLLVPRASAFDAGRNPRAPS